MTEEDGYALADDLKARVVARTGLSGHQLVCPREKSFMTPCVARDGRLAVAFSFASFERPLCVGCEAGVADLLAQERARTTPDDAPTPPRGG